MAAPSRVLSSFCLLTLLLALFFALLIYVMASTRRVHANVPGTNGRIAFIQGDQNGVGPLLRRESRKGESQMKSRKKFAIGASLVCAALVLTLTLGAPAAVAQATTLHANGANAIADSCSQSGTTGECIFVSVFRSTTSGAESTTLTYDDTVIDLNTGVFVSETFGMGTIPNSSFEVNGKSFSLNADTTDFNNQPSPANNTFCTFDPNNIPTCNPTTGGVVTGTWTEITPPLTFHITGTTRSTFPNLTIVSTGTSDSNAAFANLNFFGKVLTNAGVSVGTNHSTNIYITVKR